MDVSIQHHHRFSAKLLREASFWVILQTKQPLLVLTTERAWGPSQLGYSKESPPGPHCQFNYYEIFEEVGGGLAACPVLVNAVVFVKDDGRFQKKKKKRKSVYNPLPPSNTASWNESVLFLECLYFFFSVIHSLSGRTLRLGERTFMCRVQHLGPFLKKTKTECFLTFEKTVVMSEGKMEWVTENYEREMTFSLV